MLTYGVECDYSLHWRRQSIRELGSAAVRPRASRGVSSFDRPRVMLDWWVSFNKYPDALDATDREGLYSHTRATWWFLQ